MYSFIRHLFRRMLKYSKLYLSFKVFKYIITRVRNIFSIHTFMHIKYFWYLLKMINILRFSHLIKLLKF